MSGSRAAYAIAAVVGLVGLSAGAALVLNKLDHEKSQKEAARKLEAQQDEIDRKRRDAERDEWLREQKAKAREEQRQDQENSPYARLNRAETVEAALAVAGPSDDAGYKDLDEGTAMFAVWAATRLKWKDVDGVAREQVTTLGEALKDIDAHRGKAMCFSGQVWEIEKAAVSVGDMFHGRLWTQRDFVEFVAVGDTEGIVAKKHKRFCGRVTSKKKIGNTLGVVGMFDTAKNRGR